MRAGAASRSAYLRLSGFRQFGLCHSPVWRARISQRRDPARHFLHAELALLRLGRGDGQRRQLPHLIVHFQDDALGALVALGGFVLALADEEGLPDVVDNRARYAIAYACVLTLMTAEGAAEECETMTVEHVTLRFLCLLDELETSR